MKNMILTPVILGLTFLPLQLRGQASSIPAESVHPAIVIMVDDFDYSDADVVIVRREGDPFDVIVLPGTGANPALLAAAVHKLAQTRQVLGHIPTESMVIRVNRSAVFSTMAQRGGLGVLEVVIESLEEAEPSLVEGFGMVKNVGFSHPGFGERDRR